MAYETILYEPADGIARITLNRPEKLNAISWQMQQELQAALWEADRDPAVHVVTLRARGARSPPGTTSRRRRAQGDDARRRRSHDGARHLGPGAGHADADDALGDAQAGDRRHPRPLPGRRDGRRVPLRHRDRRRGRADRLPAGAGARLAGEPHVDVPRRAAVGEAAAAHRRHDLRRRGGAHRPRAEGGAGRAARRRGATASPRGWR